MSLSSDDMELFGSSFLQSCSTGGLNQKRGSKNQRRSSNVWIDRSSLARGSVSRGGVCLSAFMTAKHSCLPVSIKQTPQTHRV